MVNIPDPSAPWANRSIERVAGPYLYQGTSGIAVFLTDLGNLTGNREVRRTATGALRHAVEQVTDRRDQWGFYVGRTGVSYALARYAHLTRDDEYAKLGRDLLRDLRGSEDVDTTFDVIGGNAGAISALTVLAEWLDSDDLLESAVTCADHLIRSARHWPYGWSWPSKAKGSTRDLTGFAHGAAGCGAGLYEAYARTRSARFKYAAEQAFAYEHRFFSPEFQNWPDFRNDATSRLLSRPRIPGSLLTDEEKSLIARESARRKHMVAWCHGAPGIGLSRLRAYALTGDMEHLESARAALSVAANTTIQPKNYSLCHGVFGNHDLLVAAADVLGEEEWHVLASERALDALSTTRGASWASGAIGAKPDPSLLLGDAGVGHHLLRLYDSTVPSVLLISGNAQPDVATLAPTLRGNTNGDSIGPIRQAYVDEFFGTSLSAMERLARFGCDAYKLYVRAKPGREVCVVATALRQLIADESDSERARMLCDATALELARYEVMNSVDDSVTDVIVALERIPQDLVRWQVAKFELSGQLTLVTQFYDWQSWTKVPALIGPSAAPSQRAATFVVHRMSSSVHVYGVSPLGQVILETLAEPKTLDEVVAQVLGECDQGVTSANAAVTVLQQLQSFCRAGLVRATQAASEGLGLVPVLPIG
jgi:hypothetical protein